MPKTFNRKVQEVDIVDDDDLDYQYQNISTPSGINESQNFVAVDQNSLAKADNVYINEDGVLSSRPAIKSITISYISSDTQIVDLKNVDGIIFYHLLKNNEYSVAFKYNDEWQEHSCSSKLTIAFMSDMFVFFTTNDIFAYKITGEWKTYSDIIYIPKTIIAGQSTTAESPNLFVDGTATRYILTSDVEMNFSDLNGKEITVTIDDDTYSVTFVTGMQSVFTRKINNISISNTCISSVGSIVSYNTSVINNKLIITIYYSADGSLFHELSSLPLSSDIAAVLSYNVVLSDNGGTIYCLVKSANKTTIYYMSTASLSDWSSADSDYILYDYAETDEGVYVESAYTGLITVDVDGSTKGIALDDDCVVFYTRRSNRTVTCTSSVYNYKGGPVQLTNSHTCQQSFLHVAKIVNSALIVKSYSILDNFSDTNYNNFPQEPLNYVSQLRLSIDTLSNIYCLSLILAKGAYRSTAGQEVCLARILFDNSMTPFFNTGLLIEDTSDQTMTTIIDYVVVVNYIIAYEFLGNSLYFYNPETIDLCYAYFNQSILQYRYCKYDGDNHVVCKYNNITFNQNSDLSSTTVVTFDDNIVYEHNSTNLLGNNKFISTSDFESTYDTITLQYGDRPSRIKSNSDFSKILTTYELYISAYSTSFKLLQQNCLPLSADWHDSILYLSDGYLYSADWTTPIYIDVHSSTLKYNFINVTYFASFTNDFIAYDNKVCYRTIVDDQIYFSTSNEFKFSSNVTNIVQLSQTSLAVFLKNSVYIVSYEGIDSDSNKPSYTYTKAKLQLGCRDGDDVLLTYDGSTILLPTLKGLTSLSYEQLMINNEQVYSYLSDQLSDLYKEFIDGQIKLYQYKSYIIVYSSVKTYCYIYDLTNQSWWKWSCSKLLSKVVYNDESILLLIDGRMFTLSEDGQYLDFGSEVINWHFVSQKLHFGAPNNYKHIYAISLESSTDVPEDVRYALKCMNYRKSKNVNDAEIFEYNINGIRLYVKRCNYYKSNAFQFELLSAHQDNPKQMKLANIAIKYRITEGIR